MKLSLPFLVAFAPAIAACPFADKMSRHMMMGGPPPPPPPPDAHTVHQERIAESCAMDIEAFCPSPIDMMFFPLPSFIFEQPRVARLGAPSDPFVHLLQQQNVEPMLDLSFALDEMMNHAIGMAFDMSFMDDGPTFISITTYADDDESVAVQREEPKEEQPQEEEPKEEQPKEETPKDEQVLASMVNSLAAAAPKASVDPITLSKHIIEYGNRIMDSNDESEDRRRMARRLTEVDTETFARLGSTFPPPPPQHLQLFAPPPPHHDLILPFGERNDCFMKALNQGLLSTKCADSVQLAKHDIAVKHMAQQQYEAFLGYTTLYFMLAIITFFLIAKHFRKVHKKMRKNMELNQKIMMAIYSNPRNKKNVEDAIGSSIGAVPPLPPHVLARMGGYAFPRHQSFGMRMCRVLLLAVVVTTVFGMEPLVAMPVMCAVMLVHCMRFTWCPPEHPIAACSCCCCGVSTEDVVDGNVTAEQACCTCCAGSGVCGPSCAACCGGSSGCCKEGCCKDGCECCSGKKSKSSRDAVVTVYEGVPVTVV